MKRKDAAAAGSAPAGEQQSFETMMDRLQALVDRLEEGNLTLEESIRSFEEGMELVGKCTAVLSHAEQRIQKLTRDAAGKPVAQPLDGGEDEDGDEKGNEELPF
jgi:exodeoxyribonuclease VII small subunit